jgi:hypothetical protein
VVVRRVVRRLELFSTGGGGGGSSCSTTGLLIAFGSSIGLFSVSSSFSFLNKELLEKTM